MLLICHVISHDHVKKGLKHDLVGKSPPCLVSFLVIGI